MEPTDEDPGDGIRWPSIDREANNESIGKAKVQGSVVLNKLAEDKMLEKVPSSLTSPKQVAFPPMPETRKVVPRTDTCDLPEAAGRDRSSTNGSEHHLQGEIDESVFNPGDKFRYQWDIMTLALMMIVVIDVPFTVCFDVQSKGWDWHYVMSFIVDLFFMMDVVLNFNTAFEREGILQYNRKDIAIHYLRTWFLIDVASALPLDLMLDGNDDNSILAGLSRLTRLVKMLKLIRLLRIARVMRVIARIEYTMRTPDNVRTLWKFLAVVLVCAHLFTCV